MKIETRMGILKVDSIHQINKGELLRAIEIRDNIPDKMDRDEFWDEITNKFFLAALKNEVDKIAWELLEREEQSDIISHWIELSHDKQTNQELKKFNTQLRLNTLSNNKDQ